MVAGAFSTYLGAGLEAFTAALGTGLTTFYGFNGARLDVLREVGLCNATLAFVGVGVRFLATAGTFFYMTFCALRLSSFFCFSMLFLSFLAGALTGIEALLGFETAFLSFDAGFLTTADLVTLTGALLMNSFNYNFLVVRSTFAVLA